MHWDRFLRGNGVEPVVVVYEELVAAYEPTLERVLREVAPGSRGAPPAPTTRRLSDDHSERMVERLLAERRLHGLPGAACRARRVGILTAPS